MAQLNDFYGVELNIEELFNTIVPSDMKQIDGENQEIDLLFMLNRVVRYINSKNEYKNIIKVAVLLNYKVVVGIDVSDNITEADMREYIQIYFDHIYEAKHTLTFRYFTT